MKNVARVLVVFAAVAMVVGLSAQTAKPPPTDDEIRQTLISKSIAAYKGSCPCPYSKDKAGKSCGARSAYSKPGGAAPLCYAKDVSQKLVDDYRKTIK